MKTNDRIAALEAQLAAAKAENAKFEARLAKLEGPKRSPLSQPVEPEGTRVTILPPKCEFVMPSAAELLKLMEIVRSHYPKFVFPDRSFVGAFRAVGMMHRAPLDKKHYPDFWVSHAETLLRGLGDYSDPAPGFLAAVIAHNDVVFSDWTQDGTILEFGLSPYSGKPAADAWRKTLRIAVARRVATEPQLPRASGADPVWLTKNSASRARNAG